MNDEMREIEIRKINHLREAEICARMMVQTEPWITLRRDYETAVKLLSDPAREAYVAAADNGEIAGFILLVMTGAFIGYIQSVCMAPKWRNKGLGSRLMDFAEKRILSETPNVFVCVSSFNPGARRLYERLGYQAVGELKDYIVSGHSEILLRKTAAPLSEYNW